MTSPNTQSGEDLNEKLKLISVTLLLAVQRDRDGADEYVDFALEELTTLIHQRESSLLDEVEDRLAVRPKTDGWLELQAIRQERGLASQHSNTKDNEETP